jgi:hypothetical protein
LPAFEFEGAESKAASSSSSYNFSITPFITKKFSTIVIGVTKSFEIIAENLNINSISILKIIAPLITLSSFDIKNINTHWYTK